MLSSPFRVHPILKLAPVLSQKSEEMHLVHFLQLYHKNKFGDPHFLFHDYNKNSASFQWEKIDLNLLFSFFFWGGAILQNRMD